MEKIKDYYKAQIEDFIDFNYRLKKHGENLIKEAKSERYSKYLFTEGLKEEIKSSIFQNKTERKSGFPEREIRELIDYSFKVEINNLSHSNNNVKVRFLLDYTSNLYFPDSGERFPGETGKANPFIAVFNPGGNLIEYYREPFPLSDEYISKESEELLKKILECRTDEEREEVLRQYRQKMDEKFEAVEDKKKRKIITNENDSLEHKKQAVWKWSGLTAATYAHTWAESFNPAVRKYDSDCTNFVSQALEVGGKPYRYGINKTASRYWWYNRLSAATTSYTWAGAHNLWEHLAAFTNSRLIANTSLPNIPDRWNLLRTGDVVFHSIPNNHQKIQHTMIVHRIKGSKIYLAMHSPEIKNYDLLDHIKEDNRNRAWLGYLIGNQYLGHD